MKSFSAQAKKSFPRRGIVEGFFGPQWTFAHRRAMFEFGAARGMNTYLYAPKDDPYHRERWRAPYPEPQWAKLSQLITAARALGIDFGYAFHPGAGLCFAALEPIEALLAKAERFYAAGVRIFAVLFDDIPSALRLAEDRRQFGDSLARAEGLWLAKVIGAQPASWTDVEWWLCPSYYTEDPLLAAAFGAFEPNFLERLAESLPENVACFWTGPKVVSPSISASHVREIAARLKRPVMLWDNYPVNDLAMSGELHLGPLRGRDPALVEELYAYLNNPLLQEELSFVPLATCFDYAADPWNYDPERSWEKVVAERFGASALPCWRALRLFCERLEEKSKKGSAPALSEHERDALAEALAYLTEHQAERWAREFRPWREIVEKALEA
ncbi:MAG TPA: beta-N-acetylglucosaminidase domain-containing protein [Candidatus Acidoferrales bacterium]|nr:beta-N-acetylglucosaminidase domain-containing protein [Candidatus Acidoferrales bacterium]